MTDFVTTAPQNDDRLARLLNISYFAALGHAHGAETRSMEDAVEFYQMRYDISEPVQAANGNHLSQAEINRKKARLFAENNNFARAPVAVEKVNVNNFIREAKQQMFKNTVLIATSHGRVAEMKRISSNNNAKNEFETGLERQEERLIRLDADEKANNVIYLLYPEKNKIA